MPGRRRQPLKGHTVFNRLKRTAAACAALVTVALAAFPAAADPAIWVIKDEDSTIYLLGTVHILKPDTVWRTPAIDKALGESAELWVEVDTDDAAGMQSLIGRYGLDPANPLSGKLSPEELVRFRAAVVGLGADPARFEPFRPWLAGLTLSVAPLLKSGFDPKSGVEEKLKAAARDGAKPIRTLESQEQQIRFFADLPPREELQFLLSALDATEDTSSMLEGLVSAWSSGDVDTIGTLMNDEMAVKYPGLYDALLVRRNKDWAGQIQTLLKGKGVVLIAVGAAHLAGPDSVQAQLASRRIVADRLPD
ncbi:Tiki domain containing protein [Caulobacteraceae bacterium]